MMERLVDLREDPREAWEDASTVYNELETLFESDIEPEFEGEQVQIDFKWMDGSATLCLNVYLLEEGWKMYNYTDGFGTTLKKTHKEGWEMFINIRSPYHGQPFEGTDKQMYVKPSAEIVEGKFTGDTKPEMLSL